MFKMKFITPTTNTGTATITSAISNDVKCVMTYTIFSFEADSTKMKSGRQHSH